MLLSLVHFYKDVLLERVYYANFYHSEILSQCYTEFFSRSDTERFMEDIEFTALRQEDTDARR
jgi:hypothetical protein